MQVKPFYQLKIEEEFQQRIRRNPTYSLRSFSRFLGLQPPILSEILKGKRGLPRKNGEAVAEKLGLNPLERAQFLQSIYLSSASLKSLFKQIPQPPERVLNEQRHYNIISEWEYYAVLCLLETEQFTCEDHKVMAQRLNLPIKRLEFVINESILQDLIKLKQKIYVSTDHKLTTSQDVSSVALKEAHKDSLRLAREKIDLVPVEDRFYSSSTIAINTQKIPQAKKIIREFRAKLTALLEEGHKSEVYQFCIQVFPLTKKIERTRL